MPRTGVVHRRGPWIALGLVAALTAAPLVAIGAGADLGNAYVAVGSTEGLAPDELLEASMAALSGAFVHTMLEWSAVSAGIITGVLALLFFLVRRDAAAPIIAMAFFCAAVTDAFHTLAADRLIASTADNHQLIPFTWAISRTFNALVLIVGVALSVIGRRRQWVMGRAVFIVTSLSFAAMAYAIVRVCATSATLPQTMFPDALVKRPWDLVALLLFAVGAVGVMVPFHRRERSTFSLAILLGMLPQVAAQLHMTFGSSELFDAHFNAGHFLKVGAYLVPMVGIAADYVLAQRSAELTAETLAAVRGSSEEAILSVDVHGRILTFSPAATEVFGYEEDEILGQNIARLVPPPHRGRHDEYLAGYFATGESEVVGKTREVEGLRKDGSAVPVLLKVSDIQLSDRRIFVATCLDISERRAAERALREARLRLERAVRGSTDGLWDWDVATGVVWYAPRFEELLGYTEGTLAQHLDVWKEHLHPDDRARVLGDFRAHLDGDGRLDTICRMRHAAGGHRWFRARGEAVRSESGEALRASGSIQDITDVVEAQADLQRAREELERKVQERTAEVMRSNEQLEAFAYVASHDLQEPLRMVTSYTQLLQRRCGDHLDADAGEFMEYIVDGTDRMKRLIQDLLTYSRVGGGGEPDEDVELGAVLQEVVENLDLASVPGAKVTWEDLPRVRANRGAMVELFQNLVSNALKYRADDPPLVRVSAVQRGSEWELCVRDNGIGIDSEYHEKVFQLFQRLHGRGEYEGTGIGLAICKKIVERHGGRIWLESEPGVGTSFFVSLPTGGVVAADGRSDGAAAPLPSSGARDAAGRSEATSSSGGHA